MSDSDDRVSFVRTDLGIFSSGDFYAKLTVGKDIPTDVLDQSDSYPSELLRIF